MISVADKSAEAEKHTPGPWRWLTDDCLVADHGSRPCVLTVLTGRDGSPSTIGTRHPDGRLRPITSEHPNAHLIAAAPDLLAVCASIVEEHAVWVDADDWSDAPSRSDLIESIAGLVEDARAAIAKADGRP